MQDFPSRGLVAAIGWALGLGLAAALAQGLFPAEASLLRLTAAGCLLGLAARTGSRRVAPRHRWVVLAVTAGCVYGSVSDLLQPPRWLFVAGVLAAATGVSLRHLAVTGVEPRRQLESRCDMLEARAAAYRRAVRGHVSS